MTDTSGGPAFDRAQSAGNVAWFHCFSGIAGDMALGSLLDAGAEVTEVLDLLGRLPLSGWGLRTEDVLRGGIAATRAVVEVTDTVVVRTHAHIVGLIEEARLPSRVSQRALAAFAVLARVEARLHRRPISQVHFHEVGGHDTIIDLVGAFAAMEVLDIARVTASPVATGAGTIKSAHGFLPNPSPAVVRLLQGAPVYGRNVPFELTTPTGAAILASIADEFGAMPPMRIAASGFGAGARDIDELPNCTQVVVGEPLAASVTEGQPVTLLEVNVDDATGETLAHAVAALLDAGAHDAWITPIVMKKGRPAYTVSVLGDPAAAERLRAVLRTETGSLGVRGDTIGRWPAARANDEVAVHGQRVRVKSAAGRVKVEHDDAARASARTGLPVREVVSQAESAWRDRARPPAPDERPDPGGPTLPAPA